jgi:branched-chain amino acid transport system permease protein
VIDYLSANLSGDLPFRWQLIFVALFVAVIIFMPDGFAGLARNAWARIRPNHTTSSAPVLIPLAPEQTDIENDGKLLSISHLTNSYGSLMVRN